jgi:hypothetical protein
MLHKYKIGFIISIILIFIITLFPPYICFNYEIGVDRNGERVSSKYVDHISYIFLFDSNSAKSDDELLVYRLILEYILAIILSFGIQLINILLKKNKDN